MAHDRQAVLGALRAELAFLENGGYRHPANAAWRPQFMFEDSPTCLNRDPTAPRKSCSECALARFLPEVLEEISSPCRYIPLNDNGETVDSFYRTGTQQELEAAVGRWLKKTIERLEREEVEERRMQRHPEIHVKARWVERE